MENIGEEPDDNGRGHRGSGRGRARTSRFPRHVASPLGLRVPRRSYSFLNELHKMTISRSLQRNVPRALYSLARNAILAVLQSGQRLDLQGPEQPGSAVEPISAHRRAVLNELHGTILRGIAENLPGRCALHALVRRAIMKAMQQDQWQEEEQQSPVEQPGSTEQQAIADEQPGPEEQEVIPQEQPGSDEQQALTDKQPGPEGNTALPEA